jgi:transcriptional regulator with XRE-family HTH domain
MTIHSIFATNLRRKTAEYGTIADVCRGTGINRQQFNKYLAGTSFPNAVTLRNICTFLDIQEQSLFTTADTTATGSKMILKSAKPGLLGFAQLHNKIFDFYVADLPCGYYHCFFPLHNVPGMLVRSLMLISQNGKQKEFVRLTRFHSAGKNKRPLIVGRHSGIVCANKSEIYFLGVNRYSPHQLSMMAVERNIETNSGFYQGMMLTHNFNASINPKVCMIYAGEQNSPRLLLKSLGVLHESNTAIDSLVVATLHS